MPAWDAQSQINAAAVFKANECKKECLNDSTKTDKTQCTDALPQPPLYVFTDQDSRNLNLCSIAITRTNCPFNGYPIICLDIYIKKKTPDIPWYLNFNNDLAKRQLQ